MQKPRSHLLPRSIVTEWQSDTTLLFQTEKNCFIFPCHCEASIEVVVSQHCTGALCVYCDVIWDLTRATLCSEILILILTFPYPVERDGGSSRQLLLPVLANRSSAWAPWTNGSERADKGLLQQLRHKFCFALKICQGGPDYWLPPTLTINLLSCPPHYHPAPATHLTWPNLTVYPNQHSTFKNHNVGLIP